MCYCKQTVYKFKDKTDLSASLKSTGSEDNVDKNYMFSVTASNDIHSAVLAVCENDVEINMLMDCKLVYFHEDKGTTATRLATSGL